MDKKNGIKNRTTSPISSSKRKKLHNSKNNDVVQNNSTDKENVDNVDTEKLAIESETEVTDAESHDTIDTNTISMKLDTNEQEVAESVDSDFINQGDLIPDSTDAVTESDKKLDEKQPKKKKSWVHRIISFGLVIILGVISGVFLADWYKKYLDAQKVDYSSFVATDFYDDTLKVLSEVTGISSPDANNMKEFYASPTTTPDQLSASQNYILAYYHAGLADSFTAIATGKVETIADQTIYSTKLYDGKKYYIENISDGLMKVAKRTVMNKNSPAVVVTEGKVNGESADWTGSQTTYNADDYSELTGGLPSDLLPYIVSSKTILDEDSVQIVATELNQKPVYEFEFKLHEIYSVLLYQKQVKYTSGLADSPTFSDVSIKIFIDEHWNFVRTEILEYYTMIYGIEAHCIGTLYTDYTFNEPVEIPE